MIQPLRNVRPEELGFDWVMARIASGDLLPGQLIRHAELQLAMGFDPGRMHLVEAWREYGAQAVPALQLQLLRDANVALRSVFSRGYEVVPAPKQGLWGYNQTLVKVRKELRLGSLIVTHVDPGGLSLAQQKANRDLEAKLANLRGLLPRRVLRELPDEG